MRETIKYKGNSGWKLEKRSVQTNIPEPPNFCPNCGSTNLTIKEVPVMGHGFGIIYDSVCKGCGGKI
jgi:predicted nucleic-acid-binding Zn-ribbon protein